MFILSRIIFIWLKKESACQVFQAQGNLKKSVGLSNSLFDSYNFLIYFNRLKSLGEI
jgi:hypothetical protein